MFGYTNIAAVTSCKISRGEYIGHQAVGVKRNSISVPTTCHLEGEWLLTTAFLPSIASTRERT